MKFGPESHYEQHVKQDIEASPDSFEALELPKKVLKESKQKSVSKGVNKEVLTKAVDATIESLPQFQHFKNNRVQSKP